VTHKENIKDKILFSIVIPTYNRAGLITKTVISLLEQEYQNFEVIIVDDGSTDDTEEIVRNIVTSKVAYYKIPNSERGFARNFGAKQAKGDYINFFDSDDLAKPNHLLTANKTILDKNFPELFHLNYMVKNSNTELVKSNVGDAALANEILVGGNILSCNGVFLKKEIALKFPFNESRKLSVSEDWDLWLRLSARYKIYMVPTITSYIVNHEERSVMIFNEGKLLSRMQELVASVGRDEVFIKIYPTAVNEIKAHMLSYIALHAVLSNHKRISFKYLRLSLKTNYREIFTRRFLAIIKHLVF